MRHGLVLVVTLLAGCDAVLPDRPASVERDSAGIAIVENARPAWTGDEAWMIVPEPELEIGALVGAPALEFGAIGDATRFPDGVIAVVETERREIRLFDEEGFHLRTLAGLDGRTFTEAPAVAAVSPDTLLVHDPGTDELLWTDRTGAVIRRASLPPGTGALEPTPAGAVRALRVERPGDTVGVTELRTRIERWSPPWTEPVPVTDVDAGRTAMAGDQVVVAPLAPRSAVAVHPESAEVAVSHPTRWEVRRYDTAGSIERIVRAAAPRAPVDVELVQYLRGEATAGSRTPEEARARLDAFDLLPRPDSAPAIGELHLDRTGNLWVGRWTEGRIAGLEVFDPGGRWLGHVRLPPELETILEIGHDHLLARHTDEIGVPYLHLYSIRRGPPIPGGSR